MFTIIVILNYGCLNKNYEEMFAVTKSYRNILTQKSVRNTKSEGDASDSENEKSQKYVIRFSISHFCRKAKSKKPVLEGPRTRQCAAGLR